MILLPLGSCDSHGQAVQNVNERIAPALVGMDVTKQKEIDKMMVELLDGTQNDWGWSKAATLGINFQGGIGT